MAPSAASAIPTFPKMDRFSWRTATRTPKPKTSELTSWSSRATPTAERSALPTTPRRAARTTWPLSRPRRSPATSRSRLITSPALCMRRLRPSCSAARSNTDVAGVDTGDGMTASLLKDAVALLRGMDVAPLANGLYAFVANPYVIRDLQADDEYTEEVKHADPASFLTGQIGNYAGAAIIDAGSRGLVLTGQGTGNIDVSLGTLIGADAAFAALGGLQVIPATGPDKADPLNRRDYYSWKGFLGGVLNDLQNYRFVNVAVATSL